MLQLKATIGLHISFIFLLLLNIALVSCKDFFVIAGKASSENFYPKFSEILIRAGGNKVGKGY